GVPAAVDWAAVANAAPVIVMYMAVKHLGSIAAKLIAAGRDPADRVSVVCNATLPDQFIAEATLGSVSSLEDVIFAPAIVVLGPVSDLRQRLSWYVGRLRENALG